MLKNRIIFAVPSIFWEVKEKSIEIKQHKPAPMKLAARTGLLPKR